MLTVCAETLDGVWEVIGVDRDRSIVPESVQLTADTWGPLKASFDLKRDVSRQYRDLSAFTPIEIEIDGVVCWAGRIAETPTRSGDESVINVQCEGWQFHLDDDVYLKKYVHTRLSDWRDTRSFVAADLTRFTASTKVEVGNGAATIGWANGSTVVLDNVAGITLDLGSENVAKRIVLDVEPFGSDAAYDFYVRGHPTEGGSVAVGYDQAYSVGHAAMTAGVKAGTFATATSRYVSIFLARNAAGGTNTADRLVKIKSIQVFTATAYEASNASVLKASTVFSDAITLATQKLSSDLTGIETTTFNIPDFATAQARTPREMINAVNAFHNWQAMVDAQRRPIFRALQTAPTLEVGSWSGAQFEDQSAGSGQEIYNRVRAEATGPDGNPLVVVRTQGEQVGAALFAITSPAPTNPSFDVDTSGWTAASSTITRNTTTFDSSPAAGEWGSVGPGDTLTATFSGTFIKGTTYVLTIKCMDIDAYCYFGTGTDYANGFWVKGAGGTWESFKATWTPAATTTGVTLRLSAASGSVLAPTMRVDTLALYQAVPTLVDRRQFLRTKILPVQSALTQAGAEKIGDTFLAAHKTTPFAGSLTVGAADVRKVIGGENVDTSRLLLKTGELMRFGDQIDPDTGGIGRDGVMAAVTYSHDSRTAQITIDNQRDNLQALLERLAVVSGAGS